jgi:hypothetical protein
MNKGSLQVGCPYHFSCLVKWGSTLPQQYPNNDENDDRAKAAAAQFVGTIACYQTPE